MNINELPGVPWLTRRPWVLGALLLAALGLVAVELLPPATPRRKAIADQTEWRFTAAGECHGGTWIVRIQGDSIAVEHDGKPRKAVAAQVTRPDGFVISAVVDEDVGFGPEVRLITIAHLPEGRARLYLSRNAAQTRCVHELDDH